MSQVVRPVPVTPALWPPGWTTKGQLAESSQACQSASTGSLSPQCSCFGHHIMFPPGVSCVGPAVSHQERPAPACPHGMPSIPQTLCLQTVLTASSRIPLLSALFGSFPCESDDGARQCRGLPLSQLTDPRLDKVTMAPLRLRLYTSLAGPLLAFLVILPIFLGLIFWSVEQGHTGIQGWV